MNRDKKRLIIIAVYLTLLLLVGYLIYIMVRPDPTCTDGKRNQNEEDVDCGGPCPRCERIAAVPLAVKESGYLDGGSKDQYDVWTLIENPNNVYGGKSFRYEMKLKDSAGSVIGSKTGTSYILPGEQKYVIENNITTTGTPARAEVTISDNQWIEFIDYFEKPQITIVSKKYDEISSGSYFSETRGLVKNESPYDFSVIQIKVILVDGTGKVVAVNSTAIGTVRAGEEREYRAIWPNRFPGEVRDIKAQADINVFDSQSFAKKNFRPQEFQRYRYE
jgi:hypothetical protein